MTHPPSPTDASTSYLLPAPDAAHAPPPPPRRRGWRGLVPPSIPMAQREWRPGTMGVATAALICGLLGFIPLVGTVAVGLGVAALVRLRRINQTGRGAAWTGVVLGLAATAFYASSFVEGVREGIAEASGSPRPGSYVSSDELRAGDCFDGIPLGGTEDLRGVTARACTGPHEAEVVALLTLPDGRWPGAKEVGARAEQACASQLHRTVPASATDGMDVYSFYPSTPLAWRLDRSVLCVVAGPDGRRVDHPVRDAG